MGELVEVQLRPNSQHNLEVALKLLHIDGVGGLLVMRIPEGVGKPVEMTFHSGHHLEVIVRN